MDDKFSREEQEPQRVFCELHSPKGRREGDPALFALTLLTLFAAILLKIKLDSFGLPGSVVSTALLLLVFFRVFQIRTASFRYTLTDKTLLIERVNGAKCRPLFELSLHELNMGEPAPFSGEKVRRFYVTPNGKSAATALWTRDSKGTAVYYIEASEDLARRIAEGIFRAGTAG